MTIAVAIIFFEKVLQTIECIESAVDNRTKIYILNNNSSAGSFQSLHAATKHHPNLIFIHSKENLGPARGRNFLISQINESWIFFLDNDIKIITQNWYDKLLPHLQNESYYEVFIPQLYNVHENADIKFHKYNLLNNTVVGEEVTDNNTNCFPGGASLVSKSLFTRLGLYNSDISVLEDFEFSIRGLMVGQPVKAALIYDVVLHHNHIYSKSNKDKRATKIRYAGQQYQFAENYIRENYKIEYYSGWQQWVNTQMQIMVYSSPFHKTKRWILKQIKKLR